MVLENPSYFYDILPFTYVLGVSDKWIKKFEAISLQAPTWYNSSNAFDVSAFGTFVNSTMVSAQSAMSSSPSSDFDGGSSGAVVLNMWFLDRQHQHHLGTFLKCSFF